MAQTSLDDGSTPVSMAMEGHQSDPRIHDEENSVHDESLDPPGTFPSVEHVAVEVANYPRLPHRVRAPVRGPKLEGKVAKLV
eukprot:CAMPEP_0181530188 /NCGR_PEP_ID=MMETSP1110-20121109/71450_1 /TAXON_ID=174948 /ORGANISM="Symbiodinium sp., Strain CCMP421" /LENGTH=81 /DNA_ID=CAMNT_0023661207 /DNA_START=84 /DNA_END=328 /DNA_ORIENTATION=-